MQKKKLGLVVGAVALVAAIGIGSTFAYLTDKTSTVTNTFTIGNVNFDDEYGLAESDVTVDEETGEYVDNDGENTWTSDGETYENLYAGETVYKDPTVTMDEDSLEAYVFAKVVYDSANYTINYTDAWEVVESGDGYDIVMKKTTINAGESSTIFDSVTVATTVTAETELDNITVTAAAVQASGVTKTVATQQATALLNAE